MVRWYMASLKYISKQSTRVIKNVQFIKTKLSFVQASLKILKRYYQVKQYSDFP